MDGNQRWGVLGIGVAAQASFSMVFQGIPVAGPALASQYHLSQQRLGWMLAAISLGVAASEIAWGWVTDRWGDRRVLLVGLSGTALVLALMAAVAVPVGGFVPALGLLGACLLLVGVLGGSVNGSSGKAVMSSFRDAERGFAMSIRQTAVPAGGAVGAVIVPWLAFEEGFRAVFALLAACLLVAAFGAWRWLREAPVERLPQPAAGGAAAAARPPLERVDVWRLALASGLLTVPQFAVLSFGAVYLCGDRHAGLATISSAMLLMQIGGAAARVVSGRWTDLRGNRRSYIRGVGLATFTAFGAVAAAIISGAPTALVAAALAAGGLLASAWHGVAYTEIASMAGIRFAGTALGLENTTVFVGAFAAPALMPVVLAASSWSVAWIAAGCCALAAVPLIPGVIRGALSPEGNPVI